jgi:transposase
LRHDGLPLAQGTLTDGWHSIAVLCEPLRQALHERQMGEKLFYGDETRWEVVAEVEGKTGHRWSLWVTRSAAVVFSRRAPGRGADVPKAHCAKLHKDLVAVVLVGDRYSAYQCLAKGDEMSILAYGWAHVRRDCLTAARSWPELESWMWAWVDAIGELYRRKAARLDVWDPMVPLHQQPAAFVERHLDLKSHLSQMQERYEAHLHEPNLHRAKHKVLNSLHNHWDGLTVFSMAA